MHCLKKKKKNRLPSISLNIFVIPIKGLHFPQQFNIAVSLNSSHSCWIYRGES